MGTSWIANVPSLALARRDHFGGLRRSAHRLEEFDDRRAVGRRRFLEALGDVDSLAAVQFDGLLQRFGAAVVEIGPESATPHNGAVRHSPGVGCCDTANLSLATCGSGMMEP